MPGLFYSLHLLMIIAQTLVDRGTFGKGVIDAGGLIEGASVVKPFGVVVTFLYVSGG